MEIKKFEARTMKEALEMVKSQLGPDAIIVSAREITKGYGLGGLKSIEITAAYSPQILTARKAIVSKLPEKDRLRFSQSPARAQKEVMQKVIEEKIRKENEKKQLFKESSVAQKFHNQPQNTNYNHKVSHRRYIDIEDDGQLIDSEMIRDSQLEAKTPLTMKTQKEWESFEVNSLKKEIDSLRQLVSQFNQMPKNYIQSHPGAEFGLHFQLSAKFTGLQKTGILPEVAAEILKQAQKELTTEQLQKNNLVDGWIAQNILNSIDCVQHDRDFFHLFWGPSGSGKTSALIKYASHLVLSEQKRIAIISTDNLKIGADEQMRVFSNILNIPFVTVRNESDWNKLLPFLHQVDHVLVDFSSNSLRSESDIIRLKQLIPNINHNLFSMRKHLVLAATSKDIDLLEIEHRYKKLGYDDTLFTFLDEAQQHGSILNYSRKTNSELFAFSIGSKVPEDFEKATAERVLDLIMKITKKSYNNMQQENSL